MPCSSQSGDSSSDDDKSVVVNGRAGRTDSPLLQIHHDASTANYSASSKVLAQNPSSTRRSRSPATKALGSAPSTGKRTASPMTRLRLHAPASSLRSLLPSTYCISLPFPSGRLVHKVSGDFRKAGENIILLSSLLVGIKKICTTCDSGERWIAAGIAMQFFFGKHC